ncbi:MAG: hypothetical protein HYV47_00035 [Candidatus Nealsonbacteria bacterium]|nr:hypothetical protein [Candidatus Nealsonbacteria bacterium]
MKKINKYIDENLIYILENTTPYQRLLWLKRAFNFWKLVQKSQTAIDAVKDEHDREGSGGQS